MRGMLGTVELRGAELIAAAEAHDALFSFDYRARTAALEVGLPLLPPGRDPVRQPRPARGRWTSRARCAPRGRSSAASAPTRRGSASRSSSPSAARTASCCTTMVAEHRKRGALRRPRRPLRRPGLARLPRAAAPRHRQDRHGADRPASSTRRRAARWSRRWSTAPTSSAPRSSPRASSASTSSARWPTSASTSARASTSGSRPSARWRSTPASCARTPTSGLQLRPSPASRRRAVSCAVSERFFASALRAEEESLSLSFACAPGFDRPAGAGDRHAPCFGSGSFAVSFRLTRAARRARARGSSSDASSEPARGDRVALGRLQDADVRGHGCRRRRRGRRRGGGRACGGRRPGSGVTVTGGWLTTFRSKLADASRCPRRRSP